jgi:hypothetical protein
MVELVVSGVGNVDKERWVQLWAVTGVPLARVRVAAGRCEPSKAAGVNPFDLTDIISMFIIIIIIRQCLWAGLHFLCLANNDGTSGGVWAMDQQKNRSRQGLLLARAE